MKKIICAVLCFAMVITAPFSINSNVSFAEDLAENQDKTVVTESADQNIVLQTESYEVAQTEAVKEPVTEAVLSQTEPQEHREEQLEVNPSEVIAVPEMQTPEIPDVPVENIEVPEFKEEMFVKDTQNISATVIPANATDSRIRYSSSDSSVAQITQTGKITATGRGSCYISVSCGGVSKSFSLKVRVKTDLIRVKSKYVVMKPNEELNLETSAEPAEASQKFTYKSADESIVTVSEEGVLKAVTSGSTSVIVSNEDSTVLVNVIVSTDKSNGSDKSISESNETETEINSDKLAARIRESNDKTINVKGVSKISSPVLKELYGTDKTLTVEMEGYSISLCGMEIYNPGNELNTDFELDDSGNSISLRIDENEKLPGAVCVKLDEEKSDFRYFYL
ncbi:MAG: Ig-like domain-containing protein, partial [Oscillospiraceae bacterium]|nr:Ig-like domain-containing protein [Oscillospiraceae bacterium]